MMDKKSELEVYQEGLYLLNHVKEVEQVKSDYLSRKEALDKQLSVNVPKEPLPEKPVSKKNIVKYIVPILIGAGLTAFNYYYLEPNRVFDKELAYITTEYNTDSTYLVYFLILAFVLILLVIVGITSITKHKKYKKEVAAWELNCDAIETRNKAVLQEDMQEKEKLAGEAKLLELKIESLDTTIRLSNKRYQEKILPSIEEEDPSPEQLQSKIDELTTEVIEEPSFDIPETEDDSVTEEIPVIEEDNNSDAILKPFVSEEPTFTVAENISSTLLEQSKDEPTIRNPFEDVEEMLQENNEEEPTVTSEEGGVDEDFHYHPEEDEPGLIIDESTPFTPTCVVEEDVQEDEDKSEVEEPEPLFEDEDDSVLTISDIIDEDEASTATDTEEDISEESEAVEAEESVTEGFEESTTLDDSEATLEPIETDVEETPTIESEPCDNTEEKNGESELDESENNSVVEEETSESEKLIENDSEAPEEDTPVKEVSEECEISQSDVKEVSKECVERCVPEVTTPSADLIKQNKEEGYADGVSLEKLATVKRGWKLDMDIKVVSALTDLSEDKIKKIYELFSL